MFLSILQGGEKLANPKLFGYVSSHEKRKSKGRSGK